MKKSIFLFMLLSINTKIIAQNSSISIGEIHRLSSKILQEERQLAIYTPEGYATSTKKYPVLYLLDADWHFSYVAGLVRQLTNSGDILPMIIVGIVNTNRTRDLTPAGKKDNPNKYGGAEQFLAFITKEVQSEIAKNYRVQPYRILAGHSFGGLFSVYAMMKQPDFFQAYIALSPSLGRNSEQQIHIANRFFNSTESLPKSLYLAVGNEGGFTLKSTKKLAEIIEQQSSDKLHWTFQHLPKEDHTSITSIGFLAGLRFIFEGVNPEKRRELDDIFLIEQHFEALSKRFGYDIPVPEYYYQRFTQEQIGQRELDYAFFILKKWKKKYPNTPQLFLHYADAHLLTGNFLEAKKYYQQLRKIDPENEPVKKLLGLLE